MIKWLSKENGTSFSLNTTELLFGKLPNESSPGLPPLMLRKLNYVFLFAKYYIKTNKLSSKELSLKEFIKKLETKINIVLKDFKLTGKRTMKIIYPKLSYAKALELSGLLTLYDRREAIAAKLFDEMCVNQSHSLHKLPTKLLSERTKNIYSCVKV